MSVKTYSDKQLLARLETLKTFKGFPNGMLDIWVRSNEDGFNVFDDKAYTFECFGNNETPVFRMVSTGTTNAGNYGLLNFARYGQKGCAVLCADTIVYNSHRFGYHKQNRNHPAYIQNIGFPYTRDSNKNKLSENYGTVYNNIIGANVHRAQMFTSFINNWSTGCLVRNVLAQHNKWLDIMNRRSLTVAILNEF